MRLRFQDVENPVHIFLNRVIVSVHQIYNFSYKDRVIVKVVSKTNANWLLPIIFCATFDTYFQVVTDIYLKKVQ